MRLIEYSSSLSREFTASEWARWWHFYHTNALNLEECKNLRVKKMATKMSDWRDDKMWELLSVKANSKSSDKFKEQQGTRFLMCKLRTYCMCCKQNTVISTAYFWIMFCLLHLLPMCHSLTKPNSISSRWECVWHGQSPVEGYSTHLKGQQ